MQKWTSHLFILTLVSVMAITADKFAAAQDIDDPLASLEATLDKSGNNIDSQNVTTSSANTGNVIRVLLEPAQSAVLASEMDGKISRLHKRDGETFTKGDRLVTFSCESHEIEQSRLKAKLSSTNLIHENALQLQSLNSIGELDVSLAEADTHIAKADLSAATLNVRRCVINAPFSGRVIEVARKQHEWINIGEPLMEIFSDNDFLLKMLIPSDWLVWLKIGTKFKVDIDETDRSYDASITKIGARIDPVSRTVTVRGKIKESDPEFIHSMSGNAHFEQPTQ